MVSLKIPEHLWQPGLQNLRGLRLGAPKLDMPADGVLAAPQRELPVKGHHDRVPVIGIHRQVIVLAVCRQAGICRSPAHVTMPAELFSILKDFEYLQVGPPFQVRPVPAWLTARLAAPDPSRFRRGRLAAGQVIGRWRHRGRWITFASGLAVP